MIKKLRKITGYLIATGLLLWALDKYIDYSVKEAILESNDKIESLRDSLAALRDSINADVFELSENESKIIFENEFMITVRTFLSGDSLAGYLPGPLAELDFSYVGTKADKLDPKHKFDFCPRCPVGSFLKIHHGNYWYIVRILSIDLDSKNIRLSRGIFESEPES